MAQRTETELKVFLEGTLKQYNELSDTDKAGSVFFDKTNHAVYAKGECIIQSNIKDVTYDPTTTILTITPFTGTPIPINLGIQSELEGLETTLKTWAGERFVRYDVNTQGLSDTEKDNARANIGAEEADPTILKQRHIVNSLTSTSRTAPLSAAQGKALDNKKVDKVTGKQLSTEDFTTALKQKLEGLENYDDTELENAISTLTEQFNTLLGSETDADEVINTFNEIVAFLESIKETDTLEGILGDISDKFAGLEGRIKNLEDETKVESINGLSGEVEIKGKQAVIDDPDEDGSGEIYCTPINVGTNATTKEMSLGINREGALGILAMALQKAANTSLNGWVRFDNIDVYFTHTSGDDEAHITMSSTPKVWKFKEQ